MFLFLVIEGKMSFIIYIVNFSYGIGVIFSVGFFSVGEINC